MKIRIDGITYDTKKAEFIDSTWVSTTCRGGGGSPVLYRMKRTGEYFFYHEDTSKIEPISEKDAKQWRVIQNIELLKEIGYDNPDINKIISKLDEGKGILTQATPPGM